jgi:hypothetical protein
MSSPIPQTYDEWRHCIEVECGIPLTAEFLAVRIAILSAAEAEETRHFRKLYGDEHWQRVLSWFRRAAEECAT